MIIERFEDILSWQKGKQLAIETYKLFGRNKDYGFKDQIQRAVISISNNIAEGFERRSNNELKQFLFIAKGSCGEFRSMVIIARELNYIDTAQYQKLHGDCMEISKLISGLIKTL